MVVKPVVVVFVESFVDAYPVVELLEVESE